MSEKMDGTYYARGAMVLKSPVKTPLANGGHSVSVGFPVCEATDYVGEQGAKFIADALNRHEHGRLTKANMPAPDAIIDYGDGRTTMAMFFYAMPEGTRGDEVAAENGFDSLFMALGDDASEEGESLGFRYEQGEDPLVVARDWHPVPPDASWILAEKYDTEDGLMAIFVRRKSGPGTP